MVPLFLAPVTGIIVPVVPVIVHFPALVFIVSAQRPPLFPMPVFVDRTIIEPGIMGNIIMEMSPGFVHPVVQCNNIAVVQVEPCIGWRQKTAENPDSVIQVDKFPVSQIIIAFYVRQVVIPDLCLVLVIGSPSRNFYVDTDMGRLGY